MARTFTVRAFSFVFSVSEAPIDSGARFVVCGQMPTSMIARASTGTVFAFRPAMFSRESPTM